MLTVSLMLGEVYVFLHIHKTLVTHGGFSQWYTQVTGKAN